MVTSRIWFTAAQKAELWERWKNGQSAAAIPRALERKNKTGVERIVVFHGGIVPAPRRRALAALRLEEREEISRGIAGFLRTPASRKRGTSDIIFAAAALASGINSSPAAIAAILIYPPTQFGANSTALRAQSSATSFRPATKWAFEINMNVT